MDALSEPSASMRSTAGSLKAKSSRYQTLDHWRGLACLLIVIHHALLPMCDYVIVDLPVSAVTESPQAAGVTLPETKTKVAFKAPSNVHVSKARNWLVARLQVGVQFFFVISGYCIAATAYSLVNQKKPIGHYFYRRFVRIFPTYWSALAGSILICFVIDFSDRGVLQQIPWPLTMPWNLSAIQWVGSVTLTETWISYLVLTSRDCFPIQAWTLCYEVQFYVVFGILLALSRHRFFRAIAVFTVLVAALDLLLLCSRVRMRGLFIDEHWFMFAVGIGLYWDLNKATTVQAIRGRAAVAFVMVVLSTLASTTTLFGVSTQFSAWRIVEAVAFATLLLCLKRYDEQISAMNSLRWLQSCGVMCYSIYLTHLFPVKLLSQQLIYAGFSDDLSLILICIPLALLTSISVGYIFHALVERRFLAESVRATPVLTTKDVVAIPLPGLRGDDRQKGTRDDSPAVALLANTDRVA